MSWWISAVKQLKITHVKIAKKKSPPDWGIKNHEKIDSEQRSGSIESVIYIQKNRSSFTGFILL